MATQIHLANLKKLCRICGTLVLGKVNYLVNNYTDRLEIAYRCKFTGDKAEIHPEQFCNNCYCKLVNVESRGSVHCIEPISWEEHCDKCKTCVKVVKISKGGRPCKKSKKRTHMSTAKTPEHSHSNTSLGLAPDILNSIFLNSPTDIVTIILSNLNIDLKSNPVIDEEFICKICNDVVKRPLILPCDHSFCAFCLTNQLKNCSQSCQKCAISFNITDIKPANLVSRMLAKQIVLTKNVVVQF